LRNNPKVERILGSGAASLHDLNQFREFSALIVSKMENGAGLAGGLASPREPGPVGPAQTENDQYV